MMAETQGDGTVTEAGQGPEDFAIAGEPVPKKTKDRATTQKPSDDSSKRPKKRRAAAAAKTNYAEIPDEELFKTELTAQELLNTSAVRFTKIQPEEPRSWQMGYVELETFSGPLHIAMWRPGKSLLF